VDAAYGGFFTLLAGRAAGGAAGQARAGAAGQARAGAAGQAGHADPEGQGADACQPSLDPAPWRAIAECDSVVVDPHKHGLQPYGCGAVLFKDPEVGRFYLHDSPYTYFTSDELHLGEISLECSRAGASAAALWLTLQLLPLTPDGLGRVLAACRRAALDWAALIGESGLLELYQPPELDIVCYFPHLPGATMSGIDGASVSMLARGMKAGQPVFLSTLRVTAAGMSRRHPGVRADQDGARILRSVLMKPEARGYVAELHARVEELAAG
jgi:glutamate/tyrosine decarboxylase-like PLP-dependent enzyme